MYSKRNDISRFGTDNKHWLGTTYKYLTLCQGCTHFCEPLYFLLCIDRACVILPNTYALHLIQVLKHWNGVLRDLTFWMCAQCVIFKLSECWHCQFLLGRQMMDFGKSIGFFWMDESFWKGAELSFGKT